MHELLSDSQLLQSWCMTIIDYLDHHYPIPEGYKLNIYDEFRKAIAIVCDDSRKLPHSSQQKKELLHDINDWANDLDLQRRLSLNDLLREKFGFNLNDFNAKNDKRIQSVIKRGKVRNEEEFVLLKDKVEAIYDDDSQQALVETLNNLLNTYET